MGKGKEDTEYDAMQKLNYYRRFLAQVKYFSILSTPSYDHLRSVVIELKFVFSITSNEKTSNGQRIVIEV